MTDKELRRLRRADLLELLIQQTQENQLLQQELEEARAQLADRTIRIGKAGSVAEAAVELSGVFEAAQEACSRYIENMERRSREADEYKNQLLCTLQEHCGSCPKWQGLVCIDQEQSE